MYKVPAWIWACCPNAYQCSPFSNMRSYVSFGRWALVVCLYPNITKPKCSKYCAVPEACQSCGRPRNPSRTTLAAPLPWTVVPAATVAPFDPKPVRPSTSCATVCATLARRHAVPSPCLMYQVPSPWHASDHWAHHGHGPPSHPSMRWRMPPSGSVPPSFQTSGHSPSLHDCR
jgi:hypothetical protein